MMPQKTTRKKFKAAAQPAGPLLAPGYTAQAEALFEACRAGDLKTVKKLVKEGVDVNAEYVNGTTAIQHAIDGDNSTAPNAFPIVKFLVEKGADVNKPGCSYNALHKAAMFGYSDVGALLLDHGANIEARGMDGDTALHLAVQFNKPGFVKMLIDHGADLTAKTAQGHGIIRLAADRGKCGEAIEVYLSYPAESQRRRELLEQQKQAAAEATTVLEGSISISRPLQLRKPAALLTPSAPGE